MKSHKVNYLDGTSEIIDNSCVSKGEDWTTISELRSKENIQAQLLAMKGSSFTPDTWRDKLLIPTVIIKSIEVIYE